MWEAQILASASKTQIGAIVGILSVLFGAIGGAASDYIFKQRAEIETERRTLRIEAYLDFLAARDAVSMKEREARLMFTKYRVLIFGDSKIVNKLADALREGVKSRDKHKKKELLEKETVEGVRIIDKYVELFQTLREEFRPGDTITDKDTKTILCPNPGKCLGGYSAGHIFN